MRRTHDLDWDQHCPIGATNLIDAKRTIDKAESQRVGWEPDWKLRVAMLREQREEEASEIARQRWQDPKFASAVSAGLKSAWARGAFAARKQGYAKRTDRHVEAAKRLRADGRTYQEIAEALAVTPYTVGKWLGWERKPRGAATNRTPITFEGVTYPSLRAAERATGISRWVLSHGAAGKEAR